MIVRVRHPKGGMVFGKVIRYEENLHYSPFYVVDVGEYQSLKVPAHIVEKDNKYEVHKEVKNILGKLYKDLQKKCFSERDDDRTRLEEGLDKHDNLEDI